MPTRPDMNAAMRFSQSMFSISGGETSASCFMYSITSSESSVSICSLSFSNRSKRQLSWLCSGISMMVFWQAARKNMKELAIGMPRWPFQAMP